MPTVGALPKRATQAKWLPSRRKMVAPLALVVLSALKARVAQTLLKRGDAMMAAGALFSPPVFGTTEGDLGVCSRELGSGLADDFFQSVARTHLPGKRKCATKISDEVRQQCGQSRLS